MSNLRTAAQQALERLRKYHYGNGFAEDAECIADLEAALAQQAEPVQEPVATVVARQYDDGTYAGNALDWAGRNCEDDFPVGTKLYTAPPQRTMVSLTDEEIDALPWNGSPRQFARAVEKTSWEKNHGQA